MQILMIEDEPRVADFVRRGLRPEGWTVEVVNSAEEGLQFMASGSYDLVLLDVMLPGMSGVELCRHLRSVREDTPILMLSALGATEDRVNGLRTGADDYLSKPFEFDELVARIEALHRRREKSKPTETGRTLSVGPLRFDAEAMRVFCQNVEIDLSTKEREVLIVLMKNAGRVIARERLLNSVWGMELDPLTNVVDVTISRIRRKLSKHAAIITTIRNYGYRMENPNT